MSTLAIIGSAGRGGDAKMLSHDLYEAMCADTQSYIEANDIKHLCSGGAAFADHVAVAMYLRGAVDSLTLYLPARFDGRSFVRGGYGDPGGVTNNYHAQFSRSCGVNGLYEIADAGRRGARIEVYAGFKRRNLEVANACNHLIAYTFGQSNPDNKADIDAEYAFTFSPSQSAFLDAKEAGLKDGGTAHTWGECWKAQQKRHVNLYGLKRSLEISQKQNLPSP
jgi:hypothetical protein